MKKILIIGAGWEQYALISAIKNEGHYIIATHPNLQAESFSLVEHFYVKEATDIAAHLRIANTHQVDAIISDNCDYSFYTASVVASKLEIPFASIESAVFSNDKFAQREQCNHTEIKQPVYKKVRSLIDLESASQEIGFPVILKPVDSRGTFGVNIIQNKKQLNAAFYEAIHYSPAKTLICEKFIDGTLVTVDGFCFKNGHRSLAVASRKFEKGQKPVTKEIIYPAQFSDEINRKLLDNHDLVCNRLNYKYGHTHGEYIVTKNNDMYLVECTNRGGGVYTSSTIVPLITNIDLNLVLLNQSLGNDEYELDNLGLDFMKKSILLTFLDFEIGKVVKSINTEELQKLNYTVKFRSIYGENDMVESIENCSSRHSMLVIQGENTQETLNNFLAFKDKLDIKYY